MSPSRSIRSKTVEELEGLHLEAGLLSHLAHQRLARALSPRSTVPPGIDQRPLSGRLPSPDEKGSAVHHHHSPDTHPGTGAGHGLAWGVSVASGDEDVEAAAPRRRTTPRGIPPGPESV